MESWRDTQQKLDKRTAEDYKKLEAILIHQLDKVQAILKSLGMPLGRLGQNRLPPKPLGDIVEFLEAKGAPQPQYEIIQTVGKKRLEARPTLTKPYEDIWKSLEYHDKHNGEVVCVEWKGKRLVRAALKPLPPSGGRRRDDPESYREPGNLFWFRDRIFKALLENRAGE